MPDEALQRTWDGLHIAPDKPTGATVVVRRQGADGEPELLLLHRSAHGPDFEGDWAWTAPAGCRQPGEPVYPAALRELSEEAGLTGLSPWAVDLSSPRATGASWVVFAVDVAPDVPVNLVDPEHDRYAWVSAPDVRRRVRPGFVATSQVSALTRIPAVELSFRRMTLDDLPDVVRWQREPHVARWWNSEGIATLETAYELYAPRMQRGSTTRMWVVSIGGRDAGYLQDYRVGDEEEYAAATGEPEAVAFDYLIGEPDLVGKGLGTRMIWEFVRDVLVPGYPEAPRFLASPELGNVASLRALAKCGFSRGAEIVLPAEGDPDGEPVTEVVCTLDRRHWFG
jgi:8-oxo-dGTP pyrophosphatase MutT (NUDIX family)/RimJ/RimL family protein N-acetyltransferase